MRSIQHSAPSPLFAAVPFLPPNTVRPPQVLSHQMQELLVLRDSVNEDDNDVTAGDVIAVCQPVGTKEGSAWSSSPPWHREQGGKNAQTLMYPFGFQFNSASLFTYLNFPRV